MADRGVVRRAGFTLVELLLTVLIIAILSALLVPVLAPAEATQRAPCIWNMRQISAALQMYVRDSGGMLPPTEHRQEVFDYFRALPGGVPMEYCPTSYDANPYLRWPVMLDRYLRSRDVWTCPQAKLKRTAEFIIGPKDWLQHLKSHEGEWGSGTGFCVALGTWPAGWGGPVTDTLTQKRLASAVTSRRFPTAPAFQQSIGTNKESCEVRVSTVPRPAWYVVCADAGYSADAFGTGTLSYPDICALECGNTACGWVDWEIASSDCAEWAGTCHYVYAPSDGSFLRPRTGRLLRAPYARHSGGVNIGFLDGHAAWMHSETVIGLSPSWGNPNRGRLRGYEAWGPTADSEFAGCAPGVPTLY
jgi:prepilin-type processing-associated H-X9-DG protein/prepilin-type N-terminal cleavage/methylation domain-containing protein